MQLDAIDRKIVGPLLNAGRALGDFRLLVCPDHATPLSLRTHSEEPVPFVVFGTGIAAGPVREYHEAAANDSEVYYGHGPDLMAHLVRGF